jgi:hypothetical protein
MRRIRISDDALHDLNEGLLLLGTNLHLVPH